MKEEKGLVVNRLLSKFHLLVKMLERLFKVIHGKLFGDKGYICSEISKRLLDRELELFTTIKSNMKPKIISLENKILPHKRSLIETVNDQLKNTLYRTTKSGLKQEN